MPIRMCGGQHDNTYNNIFNVTDLSVCVLVCYINYVCCVSDCNYLLSCVRDDTLRLIDLRTNRIISTFEQVIFI